MTAQRQQQGKFVSTIARFMAHALKTFYCRRALGTTVNPDTIGCVWTGEFDFNTLCVDGEIFESEKKKLRIQKYPDTCGRGLSISGLLFRTLVFQNKVIASSRAPRYQHLQQDSPNGSSPSTRENITASFQLNTRRVRDDTKLLKFTSLR